jgi:hypothetical protein
MSTENDKAWERYLRAKGITFVDPIYPVDATELKELAGREPRLLAKFDTPDQLAKPLREAGYTLLPTRNGMYQLVRGDLFVGLNPCLIKSDFIPNLKFPLLTAGRSHGEAQYIDHAFNTGLLAGFLGISEMYQTIRGREYTTRFDFQFSGLDITVESVQIEVDAGYEGLHDIILVEAKIGAPVYFNVRQLYYPYRHFAELVPQKRVRNVFLTYDLPSASFTLREFSFSKRRDPLSVSVEQCIIYKMAPPVNLTIYDLLDARFQTRNILAPQADDLNKVFELLTLVEAGISRTDKVADYFVFDRRQSSYYREAAEYLGLINDSRGASYLLTDQAVALLTEPTATRTTTLAKIVVNSWIFTDLIRRAGSGKTFTNDDIDAVILSARDAQGKSHYGGTTISRRRQTIVAWIRWLAREIGCFTVVGSGTYSLS